MKQSCCNSWKFGIQVFFAGKSMEIGIFIWSQICLIVSELVDTYIMKVQVTAKVLRVGGHKTVD